MVSVPTSESGLISSADPSVDILGPRSHHHVFIEQGQHVRVHLLPSFHSSLLSTYYMPECCSTFCAHYLPSPVQQVVSPVILILSFYLCISISCSHFKDVEEVKPVMPAPTIKCKIRTEAQGCQTPPSGFFLVVMLPTEAKVTAA